MDTAPPSLRSEKLIYGDGRTAILQLLRAFVPSLPQHENEASSIKLQDAGLVSMVAVKLMLSLEAEFKIEIADHELTPENFATLDAIVALVARARSQ